jgi:hypothetical protein
METKRTTQPLNETKSLFFENINKIDKPLPKYAKRLRENAQLNRIKKKQKGYTITNPNEIQRISREYF